MEQRLRIIIDTEKAAARFLVFALVLLACALPASAARAAPVTHVQVEGEIEHGVLALIRRAVREAGVRNSDALVIQINTPGGRLDSALAIKNALLDAPMPVVAYVKREAFSAGALIALSAEKIYMAEGGVIGAATPVHSGSAEKAGEKMVSATRKAFAAVAETHGRDPQIAAAMVDESIEIEGVTEQGKLLTLTSEEALRLGMSNGTADTLEQALARAGYPDPEILYVRPAISEQIVRFVTNPFVISLLLTLGGLGLLLEFKTPGLGIGGLVAIVCYGLFFWGHHLAGLAGWEDLILIYGGLILLALEILVIPGTGLPGLLGLGALCTGLFIAMHGDVSALGMDQIVNTSILITGTLAAAILLFLVMLRFLGGRHYHSSGLVLAGGDEQEAAGEGRSAADHGEFAGLEAGMEGTALTDLRPGGIALIGARRISVVTAGDYIEKDSPVVIEETAGSRIVVRARQENT